MGLRPAKPVAGSSFGKYMIFSSHDLRSIPSGMQYELL